MLMSSTEFTENFPIHSRINRSEEGGCGVLEGECDKRKSHNFLAI